MRSPLWPRSRRGQMITLLLIGLVMAQLLGFVIFRLQHEHMVRRITRPLAQLAVAADRLGHGETDPPLAEYGSLDIQEAIRAFNHMRARLERFVQDRTRMDGGCRTWHGNRALNGAWARRRDHAR